MIHCTKEKMMTEQYYFETEYLDLIEYVLTKGEERTDRTGTGTIGLFAPPQIDVELSNDRVPLLTTKKMQWNSIVHELLWYIRGESNVQYLNENNVKIWNAWADENGDLGPVYGYQWRRCPQIKIVEEKDIIEHPGTTSRTSKAKIRVSEIDQLQNVINTIRKNPTDRRMIVNAWNVAQIDKMKLPPCHYSFQFHVNVKENKLNMLMNQRSVDTAVGLPFNIIQYSLLLRMVAHVTGLQPGVFTWRGGDVHIYKNHIDGVNEQLKRDPYDPPKLTFARNIDNINEFTFDDFVLENYRHHPLIKFPIAV